MKHFLNTIVSFSAATVAILFAGCTADNYETGDGAFSYITSELVCAHASATGQLDFVLTDDNRKLNLNPVQACTWAEEAGQFYRALLYYDANPTAHSASVESVTVHQILRVPVLQIQSIATVEDTATDPLTIESGWISSNGSYLNLRLALKTGDSSSDAQQTLGIALTDIENATAPHPTYNLQLLHNQHGVPQYYTATQFVSIPLQDIPSGSTIRLTAETYNGVKVLEYQLQ